MNITILIYCIKFDEARLRIHIKSYEIKNMNILNVNTYRINSTM